MSERWKREEVLLLIAALLWGLLYFPVISLPMVHEEVDYVRFVSAPDLMAVFRSGRFFDLADGHPALLSYVSSVVLRTTHSPLLLRLLLAFVNFFCLRYFLRWLRHFGFSFAQSLLLLLALVLNPRNALLISSVIGDFLGLSLLLGWAWARQEGRGLEAMLLLLLAVLIRETHALPAVLFVSWQLARHPRRWRELWPEVIPGTALAGHFLLCRFSTGQWYLFSSRQVLGYSAYTSLASWWQVLGLYKRMALITLLAFVGARWQRSRRPEFFQRPLFALVLTLGCFVLFASYFHVHPKGRLLTPFFGLALLPLLALAQSLRARQRWALTFVACNCCLWFGLATNLRADYPDTLRFKHALHFMLRLPHDGPLVADGNWPYTYYLNWPALGHVPQGHFAQIDQAPPQTPGVLYIPDPSWAGFQIRRLCADPMSCQELVLTDSDGNRYPFMFRGLSRETMEKTWAEMNSP